MLKRIAAALIKAARWLSPEQPAASARLHSPAAAVELRAPVVPSVGDSSVAVDVWPSVSVGFEWHDAPVRASQGDTADGLVDTGTPTVVSGGVYL